MQNLAQISQRLLMRIQIKIDRAHAYVGQIKIRVSNIQPEDFKMELYAFGKVGLKKLAFN